MTNFGIGWETIPSFPPQLVYSQTLGFVPGSGDTLPSVIPGADRLCSNAGDSSICIESDRQFLRSKH
jgi:hypothetical protein